MVAQRVITPRMTPLRVKGLKEVTTNTKATRTTEVTRTTLATTTVRVITLNIWPGPLQPTEVLIPHTRDDSDFVLESLSGDIFKSLASKGGMLLGELAVPDIHSRIRQISSKARSSTVHELSRA